MRSERNDEQWEQALLRQAVAELAQEEAERAEAALSDGERAALDQQARQLRPRVERFVRRLRWRQNAPARRRWARRALRLATTAAAVLAVAFSGFCLAAPDVRRQVFAAMGGADATHREVFEATMTIDFQMDEDGNLVEISRNGTIPHGELEDSGHAERIDVTWVGKIRYVCVSGRTGDMMWPEDDEYYVPVAVAQSLIVRNDDLVPVSLTLRGGAQGFGFAVDDGFERRSCAFDIDEWTVESPASGAIYEANLDNPGIGFQRNGETYAENRKINAVGTTGTFTYYRASEAGHPVRTSPQCEAHLLRLDA